MLLAITGLSNTAGYDAERIIREALESYTDVEGIATGGAFGVDTLAIKLAKQIHPHAERPLYYPVERRWNEETKKYATELIPVMGSYLDRDDRLAAYPKLTTCGRMAAFPKNNNEIVRSGTWATVRRARKLGVPVDIFPLSDAA